MKKGVILSIVLGFVFSMATAQANMKEMKAYKGAFPDAKLKCQSCHVDAMPKKDDGKHDMNDYGKALIAENAKPAVDTYKKVGKVEDFKKK